MKQVEPRIFLISEPCVHKSGLSRYLEHIGAPDWTTDAPSDAESLIEVMGRLCYRSFAPELNPNVRKVRTGNRPYIDHLIEVGHGSVFEHATVSFIFAGVSRVFTHELVRHRAGVAISQESLRFVRLDSLSAWLPMVIREDTKLTEIFVRTYEELESLQRTLAEDMRLDAKGVKFDMKKRATSAMRRLAPIGLSTSIGWSANLRTVRHVIEMRTDPAAEEEIRLVFGKVGTLMQTRFPNVFSDYNPVFVDGLPHFTTEHQKV